MLNKLILSGALLGAVVWRAVLLLNNAFPFNSDEAVVALMARHILQGERPIFFYGQPYMGSLDAYLIAAAFRFLGEQVWVARAVQVGLYACYMLTVWLLARTIFTSHNVARLAVLLAAIPTVLVTTYTTVTLGGYVESLILGNLILWLGYQVSLGGWESKRWAWTLLGLAVGAGFWVLGIVVVYLLPAAFYAIRQFKPGRLPMYALCLCGFLLGSSPWWYANLSGNWEALHFLLEAGAAKTTLADHIVALLLVGVPTIMGLRFPWSPDLAPALVLLIGLLVYFGAALYLWKSVNQPDSPRQPGSAAYLGVFLGSYLAIFIFTRFGVDVSGRYLLPLNLLALLSLAVLIAFAWRRKPFWGLALLVMVLALNGYQTWRAAISSDRITTQFDPLTRFDNQHDAELIGFLRQNGETRGYSNYWVSFRIAFLSQEDIIFAPSLPYKSDLSYAPSDNRYPAYSQMVKQSPKVAVITSQQPKLDQLIREKLSMREISFQEIQIGVYRVFYDLSQPVEPTELYRD